MAIYFALRNCDCITGNQLVRYPAVHCEPSGYRHSFQWRLGPIQIFSSGLNGTVLAGQSLSLNLIISNDVLARIYAVDTTGLGVGFSVDTNAGTFPGFLGPTTGFLLAPNGAQFGDTQGAGRSDSDSGTTSAGLVSFTLANLEGQSVFDISGAHFNTSLPSTGFVVTGVSLDFSLNSWLNGLEFGTAQQLPEPSTLAMTLVGVILISLAGWSKRSLFASH